MDAVVRNGEKFPPLLGNEPPSYSTRLTVPNELHGIMIMMTILVIKVMPTNPRIIPKDKIRIGKTQKQLKVAVMTNLKILGTRQQQQQQFYNNNNNVKTKVIPVIIGATATISKSFRKYVSNIPGNHEVKELQKTAILGTAHILRKVLM